MCRHLSLLPHIIHWLRPHTCHSTPAYHELPNFVIILLNILKRGETLGVVHCLSLAAMLPSSCAKTLKIPTYGAPITTKPN